MSEQTPSEINRRLAEFAGYRDIEPHPHYGHLWTGQADDCERRETTPNYWVDARAVLPLVERVCRDRDLVFELRTCGEEWFAEFIEYAIPNEHDELDGTVVGRAMHQDSPAAICLALVAVLDGDQKPNSERTEP